MASKIHLFSYFAKRDESRCHERYFVQIIKRNKIMECNLSEIHSEGVGNQSCLINKFIAVKMLDYKPNVEQVQDNPNKLDYCCNRRTNDG